MVSAADETVDGFARPIQGNSCGNRYASHIHTKTRFNLRLTLDQLANAVGQCVGAIQWGGRQHHGELFASVASNQVAPLGAAAQLTGHVFDDLIAHQMTVGIVECFEVVDVDNRQTQRLAIALGFLSHLCHATIKGAAIRNLSQGVRGRIAIQALHLLAQIANFLGDGIQGSLDLNAALLHGAGFAHKLGHYHLQFVGVDVHTESRAGAI